MTQPVEIVVELGSERFASDSEAWRTQSGELLAEMTRGGFSLRKDQSGTPGQRGGPVDVILALGSAGAFTAAVTMFQAWLAKDKSRNVKLSIRTKEKGSDVTVVLTAASISDDALKTVISKFET